VRGDGGASASTCSRMLTSFKGRGSRVTCAPLFGVSPPQVFALCVETATNTTQVLLRIAPELPGKSAGASLASGEEFVYAATKVIPHPENASAHVVFYQVTVVALCGCTVCATPVPQNPEAVPPGFRAGG